MLCVFRIRGTVRFMKYGAIPHKPFSSFQCQTSFRHHWRNRFLTPRNVPIFLHQIMVLKSWFLCNFDTSRRPRQAPRCPWARSSVVGPGFIQHSAVYVLCVQTQTECNFETILNTKSPFFLCVSRTIRNLSFIATRVQASGLTSMHNAILISLQKSRQPSFS